MSKNRRLCKLLACVVAVITLLGSLLSVCAAEEEPAEKAFRYRYVLETKRANEYDGTDLSTECTLYVQAMSADAPPLHAGSVALGIPGSITSIKPAEPFELRDFDGAAGAYETGTALGKHYVGFSWNVTSGAIEDEKLALDEENRQKLATITVSGGNGMLDAFTLVPWVDTGTGKIVLQQRQQAQASGSTVQIEEYEALMRNVWRYESLTTADVGFYQGYYEVDGPDGQRAVDIENGWQAFQIMAYNKAEPITLRFEKWDEDTSTYQPYADAVHQLADPTKAVTVGQNGKFTAGINFSALKQANGDLIQWEPGTYKLTVSKASHVQRYATDLTVSGSEGNLSLFPELTGLVLYLPCGDVNNDNRIKLQDRSLLTAPARYGKAAAAGSPYDLNGDGRVDLRDLIILEDPINYGKSSTAFYKKESLEGGGA